MQDCDCFDRYDSRKNHHHHRADIKSTFHCKTDAKSHMSSSFSIDAILSKPGRTREVENLITTSRASPSDVDLTSKPCYFDSPQPFAKSINNCCTKSCCHRSPRHFDYLAFYRYSRFVDDDVSDLPRRCLDEPTMVQVSKHGLPIGCSGCADCNLPIQRLGRGKFTFPNLQLSLYLVFCYSKSARAYR